MIAMEELLTFLKTEGVLFSKLIEVKLIQSISLTHEIEKNLDIYLATGFHQNIILITPPMFLRMQNRFLMFNVTKLSPPIKYIISFSVKSSSIFQSMCDLRLRIYALRRMDETS